MAKKYRVAVVGATGMVGQTMVDVLLERNFPMEELKLLASARSEGFKVKAGEREYLVEEALPQSFAGIDIAFFTAGETISKELAHEAVRHGAVVIDNSNAFRMNAEVPLIVPEVNPEDIQHHRGIIANPNCSTIQTVVALQPLQQAAGLKRVVAATYQAVSGAGREAVEELKEQCRAYLAGEEVVAEYIPHKGATCTHQLAFNLVPQLDLFLDDGYCKEEVKMVQETRKIMGLPDLPVTATTVRVPVINGHSIALNIELQSPLTAEEARQILGKAPGLAVMDNPAELVYPMPLQVSGRDEVYIGRIRTDYSVPYGLNLWVVADNIRKGAAVNSVQI
ncbi:MAG: aspartate-semialdehyde dehydrogenase, partial [Dethiobacteria bacterium]